MKPLATALVVALKATLLVSTTYAENWPQWRGPHFDGSSTEKNLPAEFSKTNNVKWVAPLPGPSAGTPIVWGDRVFVSSTDNRRKRSAQSASTRRLGNNFGTEAGMGFKLATAAIWRRPRQSRMGRLFGFTTARAIWLRSISQGKTLVERNRRIMVSSRSTGHRLSPC
jgi:hypothetical protein